VPHDGTRESTPTVNLPGRLEEDVVKKMLKFGKLKDVSEKKSIP
jgi:hypothetical protein